MFLFTSDIIVYVENSKESTKKLLGLISEFSKVMDTRPTQKNQLHLYVLTMNVWKSKLKPQEHLNISKENEIFRHKSYKTYTGLVC